MIGIKTADGTNALSATKKKKKKLAAGNVKRTHEAKPAKVPPFKVPVYEILSPYSHPSSYLKVVVRIKNGTDATPAYLHTDFCRVKQENLLADTKQSRTVVKGLKGDIPNAMRDSLPSTDNEGLVKKEPGTNELADKKHLVAVWPFRDTAGNEFPKNKKRKRHVTLCLDWVSGG